MGFKDMGGYGDFNVLVIIINLSTLIISKNYLSIIYTRSNVTSISIFCKIILRTIIFCTYILITEKLLFQISN